MNNDTPDYMRRDMERAIYRQIDAEDRAEYETIDQCRERWAVVFLTCPKCGTEMELAGTWWLCPRCGATIRNGVIEVDGKVSK